MQRHTGTSNSQSSSTDTLANTYNTFKPAVGRGAKEPCVLQHGDYWKGTKKNFTRTTSAELFSKNFAAIKTQSGSLSSSDRMKTIDLCTIMHISCSLRTQRSRQTHKTKRKFPSVRRAAHKKKTKKTKKQAALKRIGSLSEETLKREVQHGHHMIFSPRITWSPWQIISLPPDRQGHYARHPLPHQSREINSSM